ncbi:MAG: hypothetical protein KBS85_04590, partial [Lachnospiraceae bacterium]|nr:hypothetical protein [Candidatus Merdinaster equi]
MKKIAEIMKENTIWRMTVITIVIILCFLIFPFRVIRHYADYKSDSTSAIEATGPVTMEEIVLQQFTPQYSTIDKMNIGAIASGFHPDGRDRLFATIYDENFEIVYQEVLDFKDVLDRNGIEICPEMQFEIGATYYIGINVHFDAVNELRVTYKGATAEDSDNLGFLFYANEWIPDRVALASIYYEQPLSNKQMVFAIAGVLLGGVLLYLFGAVLFRKIARVPAFAKIISISAGIIGTAIVGTAFYFACIARIFSSVRLDVCIYAGACIIAEAILIFGCFYLYRRNKLLATDKINNIGLLKKCSTIIYLRLVSLVLTLWGCIRYIDNDGQWIQDEGRNLVIVFFGLFVLLTIKKENIRCLINRLTIAYLVLAVPSGIVYAVLTGEAEHALGNQLLLMLGFTIWGLLIIYTASIYVKMKKNPFASCGKVLGIALAVLGVSMLIFSFGKIWTIMMVIMLVVFYAQDYSVSERREHVHIFGNAVLIHFGIMAFMCLLVRPIWAYRFVRYPMWFYTVACTGMYLVLVEAVAISRLFAKMKRTGTVFKECVWEWILNGIVFGFLFLSIARTALTALAFMSLVVLIGGIIVYRPRVKQYFKTIGIAVCVLSMSVVLVYSLVRCIPSAIALPYQLGSYEDDVAEPRIGEKPNSNYYLS